MKPVTAKTTAATQHRTTTSMHPRRSRNLRLTKTRRTSGRNPPARMTRPFKIDAVDFRKKPAHLIQRGADISRARHCRRRSSPPDCSAPSRGMVSYRLKLTAGSVQHFVCAKKFSENSMRINSIDYSADGLTMITSSDDDSIFIYSTQTGTRTRNVNSKKYGVDLIRFSHNTSNAIHCSTKVDDTIRYLSLHDNKYIRYFPGHTKKVMCLSMNPADDTFLSGSLDKTIRLWDLRSQNCQGLMQVNGKAIAAFDPEGLIFAAGINNEQVKLYDLRSFDKGPFTTFKLEAERFCEWTGMTFSPCGKYIMINTNGTVIRLIDAFSGNLKVTFEGHRNDQQESLEASFSPDSQFVFCGSSDRTIHIWCTETGKRVATIETEHDSHPRIVSWNPKHFMVASACTKLCFWIPGDRAIEN